VSPGDAGQPNLTETSPFPIDVLGSGAVLLGPKVTCDGFHADRPVRVQTHIHSDHMAEFTTSLRGEVVMTKATMDLLEHDHPALPSRTNVQTLKYAEVCMYEGHRIQLLSSDHMLGAAQVKVSLEDGMTVGYSGDFSWPLDEIMKVDALVVDATYGNPSSPKRCSQGVVQEALVNLVRAKLRHGPVHLMADTGPVERALLVLAMSDVIEGVPVLGSSRICWYAKVNQTHGRPLPCIIPDGSEKARDALRDGCYLRIWSLNSRLPNDGLYDGTAIRLTKYRTTHEPFEQIGNDVFHIGFSNHADFSGTIEYVEATGAQYVVTDNHRGHRDNRAEHLARALRAQLKIAARVSSNLESREWGH